MKKKVMYAVACVALAAVAGWNYQQESELSDLTLDNVEALARNEGSFPACQKNKGSGDYATIPFCVNGSCKQTNERKGTLDVNYCS